MPPIDRFYPTGRCFTPGDKRCGAAKIEQTDRGQPPIIRPALGQRIAWGEVGMRFTIGSTVILALIIAAWALQIRID